MAVAGGGFGCTCRRCAKYDGPDGILQELIMATCQGRDATISQSISVQIRYLATNVQLRNEENLSHIVYQIAENLVPILK
eukprot:scaffold565176_cov45-Prasinocladus_malaysianus.AAC.1